MIDATHTAALRSWVESANDGATDFPIQNLPYGVFRRAGTSESSRVGVAIGEMILDVAAACDAGVLPLDAATRAACAAPRLNALMSLGEPAQAALRDSLSALLQADHERGTSARAMHERLLVRSADAELALPAAIGDYTDFYASVYHATNVGSMFRPDNPLLPNYKWVPIGYHGRASSVVASGTAIRRPSGQVGGETGAAPEFGLTRRLDYEAEVGFLVGSGNALGEPVAVADAARHLFGVVLLNDWSARDIQAWEYQPLGPFLAKNFVTTISPWVVTMAALAPYRTRAFQREAGDPQPLPYLSSEGDAANGGLDLTIEVWIRSAEMRRRGDGAVRLSSGNARDLYWTPAQLLTHHTSNGCNLQPGDLLGSGTVSGADKSTRGCMLELTWRGTEPITLPTSEMRRFLEDGDEITMRGECRREGFARIGFGECSGVVQGAPAATPRAIP